MPCLMGVSRDLPRLDTVGSAALRGFSSATTPRTSAKTSARSSCCVRRAARRRRVPCRRRTERAEECHHLEKNWRVPTDIWSWTSNNLQILGILAAFGGFELVFEKQREVHLQVSRSEPTSERCSKYGQSAKMADSTAMFWIFLDHICGSMNKNVYFASKMIWAFSII